jgi:hypothetical protein
LTLLGCDRFRFLFSQFRALFAKAFLQGDRFRALFVKTLL